MTSEKYDEIIQRLDAAGAGEPAGRLYHVCFGDKNNLRVSDIWDSRESFMKFGETLRPILADVGVDAGEPEVIEVHNSLAGTQASAQAN
ncbi:MAG: hypothetical protein JO314_12035 [Acidobacteria bacterium]|nr:hypothetical protein [Acidobacteriota bacterium]